MWKCTALIWCDWMVLLQILVQQSNFGDTFECVDRVEHSTVPVSFALYMCESALLYWHYCALLWHSGSCVCMHSGGGGWCAYSCACMMYVCQIWCHYLWSWYACIIVCVAWVGVIRMVVLVLYLLCMHVWNAWNGAHYTVKWVVGVVVNSTECVLLHKIHY